MKKKNLFLSRRLTGRYASLWVSVLAVLMMFATAGILLLVIGKNPLDALRSFLQGCGILAKENYGGGSGQLTDLLDFLSFLAPMMDSGRLDSLIRTQAPAGAATEESFTSRSTISPPRSM